MLEAAVSEREQPTRPPKPRLRDVAQGTKGQVELGRFRGDLAVEIQCCCLVVGLITHAIVIPAPSTVEDCTDESGEQMDLHEMQRNPTYQVPAVTGPGAINVSK